MAGALAGVLFVIAKGDPARLLAVRFTAGDGWIVVASLAWAAYSVLLKRWPSALGPAERLVVIIAGGVLVMLPFTLMYLSPVYAAFGAWVLLGEMPGWYHAVGAALILPSIWLATRR